MELLLSIPPEQEPIGLSQAKAHLRVDGDENDALILALIASAREIAEEITGRALIVQTWIQKLDAWPDKKVELSRPPVQSITSIEYLDTAGDLQTMDPADYEVSIGMWKTRVVPSGGTWPAASQSLDAIRITYVAGYGSVGSAVPAPIIQAMLLMIGQMYDGACSAGEASSMAAPALLSVYRVPTV